MKICTGCGKDKELTEYNKDKARKDGRNSKCKQCKTKYYLSRQQHFLQKRKDNYKSNREYYLNYRKTYASKNAEYISEWQKQYNIDNAEKVKQNKRDYYAQNKESFFERNRKRRAAKLGVNENFTAEMGRFCLAQFDSKCWLCNATEDLTYDHFLPLQPADGSIGTALSVENCTILCFSCNGSKHNKHPAQWYMPQELKRLKVKLAINVCRWEMRYEKV